MTNYILKCGALCMLLANTTQAQDQIAIRAGMLIDGRGGVQRDVVVIVRGSRIAGVVPASSAGLRTGRRSTRSSCRSAVAVSSRACRWQPRASIHASG